MEYDAQESGEQTLALLVQQAVREAEWALRCHRDAGPVFFEPAVSVRMEGDILDVQLRLVLNYRVSAVRASRAVQHCLDRHLRQHPQVHPVQLCIEVCDLDLE